MLFFYSVVLEASQLLAMFSSSLWLRKRVILVILEDKGFVNVLSVKEAHIL